MELLNAFLTLALEARYVGEQVEIKKFAAKVGLDECNRTHFPPWNHHN